MACKELYGASSKVLNWFPGKACDFENFAIGQLGCLGAESLLDSCEHVEYTDSTQSGNHSLPHSKRSAPLRETDRNSTLSCLIKASHISLSALYFRYSSLARSN